jgi:predicted nucleotidyltransferase
VPPPSRPDLRGWDRRCAERSAARARHLARVDSALPATVEILRAHHAREAYLFGSTVRGHASARPDVDIAVGGCAPDRFYRLAAELERALALPLDLVDLDTAPSALAEAIRRDGRRLLP